MSQNHETDPPLEKDPVIEAYKRDVDRTLLRENMKLTVGERVSKFELVTTRLERLRASGAERSEEEFLREYRKLSGSSQYSARDLRKKD